MKLPETLCQTEEFSCMGCCGHDYAPEEGLRWGISDNTREFNDLKYIRTLTKRAEQLRACGVCRAVVEKEKRVVCALHPMQNKGIDHRDKFCQKEYFCNTMKRYKEWDEKTKKNFLDFVRSKNPDWYHYSMNMDQDLYLKEFEGTTSETSHTSAHK
jgi:hypothetical protein